MTDKRFKITATGYNRKGHVVVKGINRYDKSHTWQQQLSVKAGLPEARIWLHAEVNCLLKAKNLRKKVHTLVVERYDEEGNPRMAFPCPSCQLAIKLSGVKKVIFTTEEGFKEWIV